MSCDCDVLVIGAGQGALTRPYMWAFPPHCVTQYFLLDNNRALL
jgi:hypothetical protein